MKAPKGTIPEWQHLRLWQIQPIRDLLLLAAIFGILYLGYLLSIVTVPLLLALALAYLFEPLVRKVTAHKKIISRPGMAIAIIVAAGVVIIVPAVLGIGFAVVQGTATATSVARNSNNLIVSVQATDEAARREAFAKLKGEGWRSFSTYLSNLRRESEGEQNQVTPPEPIVGPPTEAQFFDDTAPSPPASMRPRAKQNLYFLIDAALKSLRTNAAAIGQQAVGTGTQAFGIVFRTIGSVGMVIFQAFLTAFFFYFFCTGWGKVLSFWESLIPDRKKGRVFDLVDKFDRVIAGFIRGRLIICFVLGIVITAAYFIIGVPVPLILGPIVALLFLIPFTHWLGAIMVIIAMALEPSGIPWQQKWWWIVFAPIGVNLIGQALDDYLLTPRIQGKNTDLNMPSILFASIAGGALAGVYGLLIAIPAVACIKILLKDVFWPRFAAWAQGKEKDPLPIAHVDQHGPGKH